MSLSSVHRHIISCDRCVRLRAYCARIAAEKKAAYRHETYWGRPVPGFGDPNARVLILGLAPAAHGANRTGRVFTGDGPGGSGDFLMSALHRAGFANMPTTRHAHDGLRLTDAYIAAVVRCAPPDNKPTPAEIAACQSHLEGELRELPHLRVVVALGRVAFDAYWRVIVPKDARPKPRPRFGHGVTSAPFRGPALVASYHPSRQNTNTGKLTADMMRRIFEYARELLG